MKILLYTAVFGDYDDVKLPNTKGHNDIDVMFFSEKDICDYPEIEGLSPDIRSRFFKFKYFNDDYDVLVWFDGRFTITNIDKLKQYCIKFYDDNSITSMWFDHTKKSVFSEIKNIFSSRKKCNKPLFKKFMKNNTDTNFMVSAGFHFKKNDSELGKNLSEIYTLFESYFRDQPFIPHVFNKNNYTKYKIISVKRRDEFSKLGKHKQ